MSYDKPYAGLKVVDASLGIAGPHCGMLLALYGAEVIKIEPLFGDWVRPLGTTYGDHSAHSIAFGRGKRSLALDLKSAQGGDIARRLASEADVFIESFRPGVADRLGLGYPTLKADNPRLLYVSVSGFGQSGPFAPRPCTDTVAQAFSGLMSVNLAGDGTPQRLGFTIVDVVAGLYTFQAVAPALVARADASEGRHIDVSLMQAAAAVQAAKIAEFYLEGGTPRAINPPAGSYATADGRIVIALVKDEHFRRMCQALDRAEWADDPRYADFDSRARHGDELVQAARAVVALRSTADWMARFEDVEVLAHPVYDYGDWLDHAQVRATAAAPLIDQPGVGPVPVPNIPGMAPIQNGDPRHVAPAIGEHSREILAGLGLDELAIDELARAGVIGVADDSEPEARHG